MGFGDGAAGGFDPIGFLSSLLGGGGATATATTTQSPNVINNPSVQQGALSNSLIIGPQFAGAGGSASAAGGGFFGLGGSKATGGAGGSVLDNINYSPSTTLVSNPPPPLGQPNNTPMQFGSLFANSMRPPSMIPQMQSSGDVTGQLLAQMPSPIAAGGYMPMTPYPLNQPSSGGYSGQSVMPGMSSPPAMQGTAQQAGGYSAPQQQPQQAPQGMSMQQRLAGAANPIAMAIPRSNGLNAPPEPYDASSTVAQYPQLQGQSAQLDNGGTQAQQAGVSGSSADIDQDLANFENGAASIGEAAKPIANRVKGQLLQNKLNKETKFEPLKAKALEEKMAAHDRIKSLLNEAQQSSQPKSYAERHNKMFNEMLQQLPEDQAKKIKDYVSGQAGLPPEERHPYIKLANLVGRSMQGAFHQDNLLYQETMRDTMHAKARQELNKEMMKEGETAFEKFNEAVEKGMTNTQRSFGDEIKLAKEDFDKTSAYSDKLEQQERLETAQSSKEILAQGHVELEGLGKQLSANRAGQSAYIAGANQLTKRFNAQTGRLNAGANQIKAGAAASQASTGVKREKREQAGQPSLINERNAKARASNAFANQNIDEGKAIASFMTKHPRFTKEQAKEAYDSFFGGQ